jgi:hypothetical protein
VRRATLRHALDENRQADQQDQKGRERSDDHDATMIRALAHRLPR